MKAQPIFREKRILKNQKTGKLAVVELKVWNVPRSKNCPQGRKYSLFLVFEGRVLVGMDNHKPKGPHLHLGNEETPYNYSSDAQLLKDFWDFVRKAGFEV